MAYYEIIKQPDRCLKRNFLDWYAFGTDGIGLSESKINQTKHLNHAICWPERFLRPLVIPFLSLSSV